MASFVNVPCTIEKNVESAIGGTVLQICPLGHICAFSADFKIKHSAVCLRTCVCVCESERDERLLLKSKLFIDFIKKKLYTF